MGINIFDGSSGTGFSPPDQTNNSGKFLTTNGSETSWQPTGMTLLGSATASGSTISFTNIDQSFRDLKIVGQQIRMNSNDIVWVRVNEKTGSSFYPCLYNTGTSTWTATNQQQGAAFGYVRDSDTDINLNIYNYANTGIGSKVFDSRSGIKNTTGQFFFSFGVFNSDTSSQSGIGAITSLTFYSPSTWLGGTFYLYGVK